MKIKYKIFTIILSIIILSVSIFHFSFIVYASDNTGHGGGGHSSASHEGRNKLTEEEKKTKIKAFLNQFSFSIQYLACNAGALVSADFAKILENYKVYDNTNWKDAWWKEENIEIDDYGCITVPEDMVASIKQALQEYSNETNGYFLIPTMSLDAMSPSDFRTRSTYQTVYNLVNEKGILGVYVCNSYSYSEQKAIDVCYFADLSDFTKDGYNFVLDQKYTNINDVINNKPCNIVCVAYDLNWQFTGFGHYVYNNYLESTYAASSFDDMDYIYYEDDTIYYGSYVHNTSHFMIQNYNHDSNIVTSATYNTQNGSSIKVVTPHGDRVRVFKDLNALKYYSVDKRTVYFGSDFYDKQPTEITLKIDDFDKYMNMDFDKYFGELQDTIISQGSNLSEAEIENITNSLLGKLNDIDNNIGNVGESVQETNNLLSQILGKLDNLDKNVASILENLDNKVSSTLNIDFSGIEERLDTIIMSLGIISGQLDDMTVEEIENKTDDALKEMQEEFSDIGDLAKTKFPLSLPWDIFGMLKMLSGGAAGGGEDAPETVSLLLDSETDTFVHTMSLYGDNGIILYDDSGGSHESSSGTSHGGGGHSRPGISAESLHGGSGNSRWGAWLSDTGAPIFYMPVEFSQSMQIGGLLIIDLSGFEIIHNIGRIMFTIIFCMNLIHLTFKAIAAGKDIFTW